MIERDAVLGAQHRELLPIDSQGADFLESRDGQAVESECLFQHVEIEAESVVCHDPLACNEWLHLRPNPVKRGRLDGGVGRDAVNPDKILPIEIIGRLDEQAKFTGDGARFDPHQPDLAYAGSGKLRGFEIDRGKC